MRLHIRWAVTIALWCWALPVSVMASWQPRPDSPDRDYAKELPRIAAKSPADSMAVMHVAAGFHVELVASEPQVVDPVAMAYDAAGRLFVVEMRGYSEDEEDLLGRVRRLEDRDGDGRYETSQVFADGLSWPTAILCYGDGVIVGAAPDLIWLRDSDHDGRAERREVLYSGFGRGNVQGLMNSLRWGIDNRIHGATSSSGAVVKRPGAADRTAVNLRGRDFAIDPRDWSLVATSGGGQHGMDFDRWGNKLVCSNSDHVQRVMFEDRYVARNPYLAAPSPRISIAVDGPQADVFRRSPVEPWRVVRTRLRVQGLVPGPVEGGGRAAGYFTGATGITLYDGNAWRPEWQGTVIVGDVGSNLVHRKRLQVDGLDWKAVRIDEATEFLASEDNWFRPVQFANAPDGSLQILDMYREVIEHPKSLPPLIKRHLDLTSGRDRGRIYRVVPAGFRFPAFSALDRLSTSQLVELLGHANGWHRETTARLLSERRDEKAVPLLRQMAVSASLPAGRLRALYLLDDAEQLDAETLLTLFEDEDSEIRRHAVRLSESLVGRDAQLRSRLPELATDPAITVRYQLAWTLGALPSAQRGDALATILASDGGDRWFRLAVRSSLDAGCGRLLVRLASEPEFSQQDWLPSFLGELAQQVGRQQDPADVAALLTWLPSALRSTDLSLSKRARKVLASLRPKEGSALAVQLSRIQGGRLGETTRQLVTVASQDITNTKLPTRRRVEAAGWLSLGTFADVLAIAGQILDPAQPAELQMVVLDALARFPQPEVAKLLLQHWASLSPQVRQRAGDVLLSRPAWAKALLIAMERKEVMAGDVQPARLRLLAESDDTELAHAARKLMSQLNSNREEVVRTYRPALTQKGDREKGRAVFRKVCAQCHQVEGFGHVIGPNLAAMKNRGAEAILVNVLDPNREVNPEFVSYNLQMMDGRVLSGMIASESANSLTMRRAENQGETVLRIDIDALKSTGMSLMPEGLEKQVDVQAMTDLLAYLAALR